MGAATELPEAPAPADADLARLAGAAFPALPEPRAASSAGSVTSSRRPPTSTTTDCRSAGTSGSAPVATYAGIVLSNSVSIQRVCTAKG
ncbi:unannotated protein [freshwater metagenome]|uniref:Unannotated protein n=1 Tax=freshwater metagenome TaxID=449393 RepID=A0A6J7LDI6_9ZZZZ